MPPLFPPRSNRRVRRALIAFVIVLCGIPVVLMVWVRTPPVTGQDQGPAQPIPFDHRIHVTGLRLDCRYCHSGVERSAAAGLPSSETCVPCHNRVWRESSAFQWVRQSVSTRRPIPWVRVNRLPDFVFFNHAIHGKAGVGCETCHGQVSEMARGRQATPLTMAWCLDCHRDPGRVGRSLPAERIRAITTCTACHR